MSYLGMSVAATSAALSAVLGQTGNGLRARREKRGQASGL